MIRRLGAILLVMMALAAEPASAFEWTTHTNISNQAVQAAATSQYPDLQQFGPVIVANSYGFGPEINAHGSFNNFWNFGDGDASPQGLLQTQLVTQYQSLNLNASVATLAASPGAGAYAYAGVLVHLIEDGASPPHAANIPHGLSDGIESYAENHQSTLAPGPGSPTNGPDVFTFYQQSFNTTASHFTNWTVVIPQGLQQANPPWPSPEAYWVANPQYNPADLTTRPCRGVYGGGPTVVVAPCNGNTAQGNDIFNQAYPALPLPPPIPIPPNDNIVTGQEAQAVALAAGMLQAISRSLPPLVKNLSLSSNILGPSSPILINFDILENRTPNETYTIQAVKSDGSAAGTIRDAVPIQLTQLPGAPLPYKGSISNLSWDGTLTDGTKLASGQYQLCVSATDGDNNTSPGVADGATDTCVNFTTTRLDFSTRAA